MNKQVDIYLNYTVLEKTKVLGSGSYYIKIRKNKDSDLQRFNNFIGDLERLVEDKLK